MRNIVSASHPLAKIGSVSVPPAALPRAMKERPILMSAPMVRAILAGTKTQTRRIVKLPRRLARQGGNLDAPTTFRDPGFGDGEYLHVAIDDESVQRVYCPYADTPGDRLWVREAWRACKQADHLPPRDMGAAYRVWHEAEAPHQPGFGRYRHARFMPRWASRMTLEVTGVRVERLQDISEADARAEGAPCVDEVSGREVLFPDASKCGTFKLGYRCVWEQINGAGSWDANAWVWVVEFRLA